MRKTIFVSGAFLLLNLLFIAGLAQEKEKNKDKDQPKIEGSGNVITKDVAVQSFEELEAKGIFNVILTQGSKEAVKIEAEDNLQQLFEVKNEGKKLIVSMKKDSHFNSHQKMIVYITFKNLKSMDLKMVGNLTTEGNLNFQDLSLENKSVGSVDLKLAAQKLDIKNKSVGNLKLSGKANNAVIRTNSVGSIKASDFVVQTMDIDNDGIGSAEVNAAKELKVRESFLGKVRNVGAATAKKKIVI
jgi:Putative auto-transporter adhesin, head GIN domain